MSVSNWNNTALFRSTLSPGTALALGLPPLAPDIDFTSGRELAVAGMSERDVFLKSFLTPRLNARLGGMRAAVADFSDPNGNPWTRSWETQDQVRDSALRATKSAVKRYALERLYLTGWSLPLGAGHGRGLSAFRTESGGPRLRFGFSHRAPRVEARARIRSSSLPRSLRRIRRIIGRAAPRSRPRPARPRSPACSAARDTRSGRACSASARQFRA